MSVKLMHPPGRLHHQLVNVQRRQGEATRIPSQTKSGTVREWDDTVWEGHETGRLGERRTHRGPSLQELLPQAARGPVKKGATRIRGGERAASSGPWALASSVPVVSLVLISGCVTYSPYLFADRPYMDPVVYDIFATMAESSRHLHGVDETRVVILSRLDTSNRGWVLQVNQYCRKLCVLASGWVLGQACGACLGDES